MSDRLQTVDLYTGVPDTGGLASGVSASVQMMADVGPFGYKDGRLRNRISVVAVVCGEQNYVCLKIGCLGRYYRI